MPDLTVVDALTCRTNLTWEQDVRGSKGDVYKVKWEKLPPNLRDYYKAEYAYTCTCPYFTHKSLPCKHIKQVQSRRCAWNSEMNPTPTVDKCPNCGGDVVSIRVRV